MEQKGKNPFYERLKTYVGKTVSVVTKSGGTLKGKLVAVNFTTMNFIIEGKTEDYVVRDDISYMSVGKEERK